MRLYRLHPTNTETLTRYTKSIFFFGTALSALYSHSAYTSYRSFDVMGKVGLGYGREHFLRDDSVIEPVVNPRVHGSGERCNPVGAITPAGKPKSDLLELIGDRLVRPIVVRLPEIENKP